MGETEYFRSCSFFGVCVCVKCGETNLKIFFQLSIMENFLCLALVATTDDLSLTHSLFILTRSLDDWTRLGKERSLTLALSTRSQRWRF